jgi:predicted Zn-dependent peptidase
MQIKERQFSSLREKTEEITLENGLSIFYIPKPDFAKTFALFATNFGSVDSSFTLEGEKIHTPDGVAHFLEHKMFEDADGNALQKFARTGASPNAYTSYAMTAYHFSCTDRFMENLEILLRFVSTPYFTDENVEKEKGIIGQEIGMIEDSPGWVAYTNALKGLYAHHTVRSSIAGTVASIAGIDKELLFRCHRAFYAPANMKLVICGQADLEQVVRLAEEILPAQGPRIAQRDYGQAELPVADQKEITAQMAVSQPIFMLGIKTPPLQPGESRMRRECLGELALEYILGESSPFYNTLYEERLISDGFGTEYFIFPQGAAVLLGGESRDPAQVQKRLLQTLNGLEALDEERVERLRRRQYGLTLRQLDDPGSLCRAQAEYAFAGEDFLDFPRYYADITSAEILVFLRQLADGDKMTLSVVQPKR